MCQECVKNTLIRTIFFTFFMLTVRLYLRSLDEEVNSVSCSVKNLPYFFLDTPHQSSTSGTAGGLNM
jgi:hypothetical protein